MAGAPVYVISLFHNPHLGVWSVLETTHQRIDWVMHSLDNFSRRGSLINGVSDLAAQPTLILKANILQQHKGA